MATYNGAAFLEEQLSSLSMQKVLPHELFVTDDGSTDATLEILKEYSAIAPFPVHIGCNSHGLGYGRNFLKAALHCKAQYVAFCDQDDVWHDGKLQLITKVIEKMSPDVVVHGGIVVDQKLRSLGFRYPDIQLSGWFQPKEINEDLFWPGYSLVIKSDSLLSWGIEQVISDENLCRKTFAHDRWIFNKVIEGASCYQIPEELVKYRQHASNLIGFESIQKNKKYQ